MPAHLTHSVTTVSFRLRLKLATHATGRIAMCSSDIASKLNALAAHPDLPPRMRKLFERIEGVVSGSQDDGDPLRKRRNVEAVAGVLQDLFGTRALDMARQIGSNLGDDTFSRLVTSELQRQVRLADRTAK
ncbi:MAG: hypothetical protein INR68_00035 [Methylobacterium mesophilicum]|nr:hypothetical protein [Methylobacterium mesophilicum]